ncbi:hypothetical protein CAI21_13900 [Alkalilimnicola ehrlichii]|uniref:ATP-grasp domain-containing protein n=1 Tax=Alkalilimnicola ehrlichii TaxID=351052 RepID=A0A3E0WRP9_9GAMM|nr:ATP-grasp domain-containing protein [Alkalilimnicola ehrlichii]RFA28004.1 hypothetical protein CAI21_13900 [Alkalilimnicola ehrlichii]RFA34655.1 hypothetical protein CAL65_14940 [Alkalilimnicola ehrlichii]
MQPQYNKYDDEASQALFAKMTNYPLGPLLLAEAAESDGARISWMTKFIFTASLAGTSVTFWDCRSADSSIAAMIASDKAVAKKFMLKAGVPVPTGRFARTPEKAVEHWKKLGEGRVVIKPKKGQKGRGVSIGISDEAGIVAVFSRSRSLSGLLVEEMVEGEEYRILVVGGRVISALGREAANVIGDGISTISELVRRKNVIRSQNPHLSTRLITEDDSLLSYLSNQGLSVDHVPAAGQKIRLKGEANFSAGGDSIDCTDDISEYTRNVAVQAVASIPGLEWAGVDVIVSPATEPDGVPRVVVLEVNTNPAIGSHHYPLIGKPRNAATAIWRHALKKQEVWDRFRDWRYSPV